MELNRDNVKDYFSKQETVSKWWDPEDKPSLFRDLYIAQRSLLGELLDPKGKLILDAGTGKGRFAISFAKAGASRVYATDLSKEMLEIAQTRAKEEGQQERISFQAMDIEDLKFEGGFFDAAVCMETFVHLPSPRKAMKELVRVVKPGGTIISSVTLPPRNWYLNAGRVGSFRQLFEWLFTPFYLSRVYQKGLRRVLGRPPLVGRPLPKESFIGLFKENGLLVQREAYLGHPRAPHFLVIAAQKPSG